MQNVIQQLTVVVASGSTPGWQSVLTGIAGQAD